jgi:hypothetical protein
MSVIYNARDWPRWPVTIACINKATVDLGVPFDKLTDALQKCYDGHRAAAGTIKTLTPTAPSCPMGANFVPEVLRSIPAFDLPAIMPGLMQGGSGWASWTATAALNRCSITVEVPDGVIPTD